MSIYKIYKEGDEEQFYIGSTKDFKQRQRQHKHYCKKYDCKLYNYINENGGWDCFKMEVLEYCLNYQERERELIKQLQPQLNMKMCNFNRKEHVKEYGKKYREENKKKLNERDKKKYQKNKEKIKTQRKKNYYYKKSWGGDARFNNNLLNIDINLMT